MSLKRQIQIKRHHVDTEKGGVRKRVRWETDTERAGKSKKDESESQWK